MDQNRIAIYPEDLLDTSAGTVPGNSEMWIFLKTLDQTNCQGGGKRLTGSVMFDENDPIETGVQIWPLEAGSYQVFILRDVSPPYPVVASSGIITITGAPNSPTMTPTRNPTSSPSEKATVPTRAPTGSPTSPMNSPTKAPSHAPTPDGPSLTLISTPYTAGDDIVVDFVYPGNPGGGAWLSLWPADSDPNSLPSPSPYWNYICSDSQSSTCGTSHIGESYSQWRFGWKWNLAYFMRILEGIPDC